MVKQVPDANPLKPLLKQIEHLAAYATTYRYATSSGNIKPAPDDATLGADMASVSALPEQLSAPPVVNGYIDVVAMNDRGEVLGRFVPLFQPFPVFPLGMGWTSGRKRVDFPSATVGGINKLRRHGRDAKWSRRAD
ncbi:MAG TPA: hypothetical protein VI072_13890 [Polyangiaceae bacterium]